MWNVLVQARPHTESFRSKTFFLDFGLISHQSKGGVIGQFSSNGDDQMYL